MIEPNYRNNSENSNINILSLLYDPSHDLSPRKIVYIKRFRKKEKNRNSSLRESEIFPRKIAYPLELPDRGKKRTSHEEGDHEEEPLAGTRLKLEHSELGRLFRTAFEAWPSVRGNEPLRMAWRASMRGLIGVL